GRALRHGNVPLVDRWKQPIGLQPIGADLINRTKRTSLHFRHEVELLVAIHGEGNKMRHATKRIIAAQGALALVMKRRQILEFAQDNNTVESTYIRVPGATETAIALPHPALHTLGSLARAPESRLQRGQFIEAHSIFSCSLVVSGWLATAPFPKSKTIFGKHDA